MSANPIQEMKERVNWHWRYTMRPVRFFSLDARAIVPFVALLFYIRLITLILAIFATFVFWTVEKMGLTFPSALRKLRRIIIGERRPALVVYRHRRFVDYG